MNYILINLLQEKRVIIKVSKRHQSGGLGHVLTTGGDRISCWGRKETPLPNSLGSSSLSEAHFTEGNPLPPEGPDFSPRRVSGLQGIFVVDRSSLKVEGFTLISSH